MLPSLPDNAAPSPAPTLPPALSLDDPAVQALRAKTLSVLQASLDQMVADVRRGMPMPEVQRAFIARHTTALHQAYLAARRLGAIRYYAQVSHTPDHWAEALVPSDPDTVRDRLTFYAAGSVHNLASQVAQAQHDATLHITGDAAQVLTEPPTTHQMHSEMPASATRPTPQTGTRSRASQEA